MTPTYQIAMSAGLDAGNRSAKRNGRTEWNEEDWNAATAAAQALTQPELQQRVEILEYDNAMLECLLHESRQREALPPDPEFF